MIEAAAKGGANIVCLQVKSSQLPCWVSFIFLILDLLWNKYKDQNEQNKSAELSSAINSGKGRCQKKNEFIWDFVQNYG